MENRAIFIDRDGVLNHLVPRGDGYYSPRTIADFLLKDDVEEGVTEAKRLGFLRIVVSNQPDISRGKMSAHELELMTKFMLERLDLDDVLYCTHDDQNDTGCRKPKPGLFLKAQEKWQIDLSSSFMIGDTWRDVEAANQVNITPILIDAPYNQDTDVKHRVNSFIAAVSLIDAIAEKNKTT